MKGNESLKQYMARVKREAVVKSLLIGLVVGASAASLTEFICWFVGFKEGLYIAIALLVALTAGVAAVVYIKKFKPTQKAVASRIDELGLEERVLTMLSLEGDDSYIARAQREDTQKSLGKVNHLLIKFALATSLIVSVSVMAFVAVGMTTVSGLAYADIIPSGLDLIANSDAHAYYANYSARNETMGKVYYVTSNWEEPEAFTEKVKVDEGEDAPAVIAVANYGYVFVSWSDGKLDPVRQDVALHGNVDVFAIFRRDAADEVDDDQKPENDSPIAPPPPISDDGEDGGGGLSGPSNGSGAGGGKNDSRDQILDGKTYYGDNYNDSVDDAQDSMNDSNTSDKYKDAVSGYLDALNPGGNDDGDAGDGNGAN